MKTLVKKLKTLWWRMKSYGARCYYGNPSSKLKIVGVTGTNGKTTTVTLLYQIATALGYKAGLVSTVEILIAGEKFKVANEANTPGTTPDSVNLIRIFHKMVLAHCEYVFMEVSSHAMDQRRVAGVKFVGGIFTNLTHDHLDYHKSLENYFLAKKKFFKMLPSEAFALANSDDEHGKEMLEGIKAKKYTYGFKDNPSFNEKLETKLLGNFNEYNALAVYAAAVLLGLDKDKVKEVLRNVVPPRGRFEHFTSPNGVVVVVDYAHTPDALENIFRTTRDLLVSGESDGNPPKAGKLISIFGCGGDRDPLKRKIMGKIGADLSDIAIFTSDNPRSEDPDKIIAEMKTDLTVVMSRKVIAITNRREAIKESIKLAQKGDIILCAGKGHEEYQEIKGVRSHFSDREEYEKIFLKS